MLEDLDAGDSVSYTLSDDAGRHYCLRLIARVVLSH